MNAPAIIPSETLPVLIDRAGYVYAIRNDDAEAVKIGFSNAPIRRLAQLQTASPARLRLLCAIPSFPSFEVTMHDMFEARRLSGEWFSDHDGFVTSTMIGTADFLIGRCGLTISDIHALTPSGDQLSASLPRASADARNEHADALEAEGQMVATAA